MALGPDPDPASREEADGSAAASFFDGRSARRWRVRVRETGTALRIVEETGTLPAMDWPLAGLRFEAGLLSRDGDPDARLAPDDPAWLEGLRARNPRAFRSVHRRRQGWRTAAFAGGLLAAVIALALWIIPASAPVVAGLVPDSWKAELGDAVVAAIGEEGGICAAPAGERALQALARRLLADTQTPPPRIVVLKHPGVNAFAAPGGRIVVLGGLIRAAETPDEVAGVLAHEIGHHLEDHAMENIIRHSGIALMADALTGGSGLVSILVGAGGLAVALSHQREDEREADRIAAGLLARANISAEGLVAFFERQAANGRSVGAEGRAEKDEERRAADGGNLLGALWEIVSDYASTHPDPRDRAAGLRADEGGQHTPALEPADWQALRTICATTRPVREPVSG